MGYINALRRSPCLLLLASGLWLQWLGHSTAIADEPQGTAVAAGASVDLFKALPELAHAPKNGLATIECLVRPDAEAIERERAFILILSNRGGQNTAGISLTLNRGVVRANVLGTMMQAGEKLNAGEWSHIALTIDPNTINKQARLWIDGKRVADELVLEYWPKTFEVAEMLSDHWNQGREFSGELGDVRISRVVRYRQPFSSPEHLENDEHTVLLLEGGNLPLQ